MAEWLMLPRFYEPLAHNKSHSRDEAAHDKFVKELLALGDKAVAAAGKAGKRGSKAKKAAPDFLAQYRALSGAEKTAFAAKHSSLIYAAFTNAR